MCISGLRRRVFTSRVPSGIILANEISTIRSLAGSTPVVSKSRKTIGFVRFSFMRYALIIIGISSISVSLLGCWS